MTKKELFLSIKEDLVATGGNVADYEEKIAFIDEQVKQIDTKADKARERAANKKAEGDALREAIYNTLTSEPKTIPAICAELGDEEITEAKVRARLSQLVSLDRVEKEKVKVDGGEKMGYFIPAN